MLICIIKSNFYKNAKSKRGASMHYLFLCVVVAVPDEDEDGMDVWRDEVEMEIRSALPLS